MRRRESEIIRARARGGTPDRSEAIKHGLKPVSVLIVAVLLVVASAGAVHAHKKQSSPVVRELLRIQGYREVQATDAPAVPSVELLVLGQKHAFRATKWRLFRLSDSVDPVPAEVATQFTLQGDRATLRRFGTARPEQLVTILAERRPGSRDLFVVEVDLCPPN